MYLGAGKKTPRQLLDLLLSDPKIWTYSKLKILFYDIETAPLKFWGWRPGEQFLGHANLDKAHSQYHIISIQYCWNDGKPGKHMHWGKGAEIDNDNMILEFDKLVKSADLVIGKNNKRFDDKHINAQRMLQQLPQNVDWIKYTDDLEQQFRKHFNLPSQSLDYISSQLGLGGKVKMELQDWVNICDLKKLRQVESVAGKMITRLLCPILFARTYSEIVTDGVSSFDKMMEYGTKDVVDTRSIWIFGEHHFESKFNMASYVDEILACKRPGCGSTNLYKNGFRYGGKTKYQRFNCSDCGGYAGRSPVKEFDADYVRVG